MKNGWLLKTDPDDYTYDDLERDGKTIWDGVANNLALQNLRKVRRGDRLLIYHTGAEKSIIGLAEAASDPYTDPKATDQKLVVIDIRPRRRAKHAATLEEIKQTAALASFQLVRLPRLSVVPVSEQEWSILAKMTGL
jgi:predicted RNA-binding protein with PUA-like domain